MNIKIEKLVFGGQGFARVNGKAFFVWNALPDETVKIEILKNKKTHTEAVATEIIIPSPERVIPKEASYLSTSPWQVLDPAREGYWKRAIAAETYSKIGSLILQEKDITIAEPDAYYGYRNKMEFSFTQDKNGKIFLGFFERGKHVIEPVEGSALALPVINETAQHLLAWVREQKIPIRSLKAMIVRANRKGEVIAGIFLKDQLTFSSYPELTGNMIGCTVYYSTHKSPASVPTAVIYQEGINELEETILELPLRYGLFSFFQVNPDIFEVALKDIAAHLDPKEPILDFYSGVGTIGLSLSRNRPKCLLVESNEEAAEYATVNIKKNKLKHCEMQCLMAEKALDAIDGDTTIILDPPRAGLHPDVTKTLSRKCPPKIIYLSCDLATQARDIRMLSEQYKVGFLKLYNFFPRTPHIEGLCVLEHIQ